MREHIDVDLYDDKEDAIQAALDGADIGSHIIVCRSDWGNCPNGEICQMCARVEVTDGITARDILNMAKGASA